MHTSVLTQKVVSRPCTAFADFDTTRVTEEQGAASRELIQRLTLPQPTYGYLAARLDGKGANMLGGPSNRGHDLEQGCFPPNPAHQRHWDIVHHVTVHGADVPIPEVGVIESLEGDNDMFEEAAGALSKMKSLFELATKEERQAKREGGGYDEKPAEGATTGAVEIRFERKWNDQEDLDAHDDAIKLMEEAILGLVAEGGPVANKNAVFLLKRLRSQCQGGVSDEADQFNAVLARLEGSYGGADRKHPFWAVVGEEQVVAIPVRGSRPREGVDIQGSGNKEEGEGGGSPAGEPEGKRQKMAQGGGVREEEQEEMVQLLLLWARREGITSGQGTRRMISLLMRFEEYSSRGASPACNAMHAEILPASLLGRRRCLDHGNEPPVGSQTD